MTTHPYFWNWANVLKYGTMLAISWKLTKYIEVLYCTCEAYYFWVDIVVVIMFCSPSSCIARILLLFFQQSKRIYIRMYVNSTDYGLLHLKWFTLYFVFCGDKNRCGLWLAVICNVHLLLAVDSVCAMKLPCVTGCFITSK